MTRESPRVSVGMPVYNGERHLPQAIESILGQTFTDLELIVSDNGSTDATEEICRRYAAGDGRVRYYRNRENLGVARNYNAAFGYARGTYFKWASSNDVCDREFLAACVEVLDREPDVVLVCPMTRYLFADESVDDAQRLELLDADPYIRFRRYLDEVRLNNVMNGLMRADVLRRTALHRSFQGSDVNLVAEIVLHGKLKIVPQFLFWRRMEAGAASFLRSDAEMDAMFEPNRRGPIALQSWKENFAYLAAVRRAPLGWRERLRLYRYLSVRLIKDRGELVSDLLQALRSWLGRPAAGAG